MQCVARHGEMFANQTTLVALELLVYRAECAHPAEIIKIGDQYRNVLEFEVLAGINTHVELPVSSHWVPQAESLYLKHGSGIKDGLLADIAAGKLPWSERTIVDLSRSGQENIAIIDRPVIAKVLSNLTQRIA